MQKWRNVLLATLCTSLSSLALSDVFNCPAADKLTMKRNSGQWEAKLKHLPDGMPDIYRGARYSSDGEYDRHGGNAWDVSSDDMPLTIRFNGVWLRKSSGQFINKCFYTSDKHKDLSIEDSVSLSDSTQLPLIVTPYRVA